MQKSRWPYVFLVLGLILSLGLAACDGDDDEEPEVDSVAPALTEAAGELEGAATEAAGAIEEAATEAEGALEGMATEAAGELEGAATEAAGAIEGAATEAEGALEGMATEAAGAAEEAEGALEGAATEAAGAMDAAATEAAGVAAAITGEGDTAHGEELVQANCTGCHAIDSDEVLAGPSLQNIGAEAEDRVEDLSAVEYLHQSLVEPDAYKPEGFEDQTMPSFEDMPESDLNDVIAYLLTLTGGA